MKKIFVWLAMMAMCVCVQAGIESAIPPTNQVVLSSGAWTPSPEQTQKALVSIQAFLSQPGMTNRWQTSEGKKILANFNRYRVQFVGVVHDGKKVVWCNFFPGFDGVGQDEFQNWKQAEVSVDDGGFGFWHIFYDPDTDSCSGFMSNGYG